MSWARTLVYGSHGADVARLQRRLGVSADGNYGPGTYAAVQAYQRAHGLAVDGIAGPEVQAALNGTLPGTLDVTAWGTPGAPFALDIRPRWLISSGWGPRADGPHYGVDISGPGRTWDDDAPDFLSPCDGEVVATESDPWGGGYGTFLYLRPFAAPGLVGRAAHLAERRVRVGDRVRRGELLGRFGMSGHSFGVHLHWETRRLYSGEAVHLGTPENPEQHTHITDASASRMAA